MGRPTTRQRTLRNGFYIEIRNRNSNIGVKIRRDNKEQMLRAVKDYERSKNVIVLGEIQNGKILKK